MKPYHLFTTTALLTLAASQATVPSILSESFTSDDGLQVSFGGDASEGLQNGATVNLKRNSNLPSPSPSPSLNKTKIPNTHQKTEAAQPPTFALGDASGVNRAATYLIMMLDTTDPAAMTLHYLQSGFQASGDKTKLEPQGGGGEAEVPYTLPTATDGPRDYTFLLYRQQQQRGGGGDNAQDNLAVGEGLKGLPAGDGDGEAFDVKAFEEGNELQPARAGLAVRIDEDAGERDPSSSSRVFSSSSSTASSAFSAETSSATTAGDGGDDDAPSSQSAAPTIKTTTSPTPPPLTSTRLITVTQEPSLTQQPTAPSATATTSDQRIIPIPTATGSGAPSSSAGAGGQAGEGAGVGGYAGAWVGVWVGVMLVVGQVGWWGVAV
ncbi:hypothetical protein FQN52_007945 [Onygenales sp. PD_12]|nr:hypothetical protein FQN52_007945 [Onygenales sp. PD_12]